MTGRGASDSLRFGRPRPARRRDVVISSRPEADPLAARMKAMPAHLTVIPALATLRAAVVLVRSARGS